MCTCLRKWEDCRLKLSIAFRDAGEWDVAAGDLIAREAGACLTDRTGGAIRFNSPGGKVHGVIAAGPALHAKILARV